MTERDPESGADRLNDVFHEMLDDLAVDELRSLEHYQEKAPGHAEAIAEFHRGAIAGAGQDAADDPGSGSAFDSIDSGNDLRHVGPYRIVERIGRGGQGAVYLAVDRRLGRKVALKVLADSSLFSEDALRRFRREAEITSRLDHPGICPVFEAGSDRGRPYIAMRFIDGQPLSRRLRVARSRPDHDTALDSLTGARTGWEPPPGGDESSGPRTWPEIAATVFLLERVSRALHAAHEAGVIHRDIKPGNILVGPDEEPVIVDFGLARRLGDETVPISLTGDFLGTPHYMSPEQVAPGTAVLDRRTDVYSLGITLFECLTLRRPFESPTREGLLQAILTQETPDGREFNPRLPADLRLVVRTAMERDRERRYATALQLAEDLQRVRERQPILARPLPRVLRLRRWVRRNPGVTAAIAILSMMIPTLLWYLMPAEIRITSQTEGVTVLVNGREEAGTTPMHVEVWPFSRARVTVRRDGFEDSMREISLRRFGITEVPFPRLIDTQGTVDVRTRHSGITASIRRLDRSESYARDYPLPFPRPEKYPEGTYSLTAQGRDDAPRTMMFRVRRGERTTVDVVLGRALVRHAEILGEQPGYIHTEDLDEDGRQDLLLEGCTYSEEITANHFTAVSGLTLKTLWDREFIGARCLPVGLVRSGPGGKVEVITFRADDGSIEVASLSASTGRTLWSQKWSEESSGFGIADVLPEDPDGIPDLFFGVQPPTTDETGFQSPCAVRIVDLKQRQSVLLDGFPGRITSYPVAVDLNDDGRLEICAGIGRGDLMILDPHQPARSRREHIVQGECRLLVAGDADGDGRPDLLIGASEVAKISLPDDPKREEFVGKAVLFTYSDGGARCIWKDDQVGTRGSRSAIDRLQYWPGRRGTDAIRIALLVERKLEFDKADYRLEVLDIGEGGRAVGRQAPIPLAGQVAFGLSDLSGDGVDDLVLAGGIPGEGLRTVRDFRLHVLPGAETAEPYAESLPDVDAARFTFGDFSGLGSRDIALLTKSSAPDRDGLRLRIGPAPAIGGPRESQTSRDLWVAQAGDAIWSSPAIGDLDGDGRPEVVVGSHDQHLHAYSGADGREIWKHPTGGAVWSSPALADLDGDGLNDVVAGSNDRCVHAISGRGGRPLWRYPTGNNVVASPALVDLDEDGTEDVIIGSHDGFLYAISGRQGTLIWRFPSVKRRSADEDRTPNPSFYARATVADLDGDGNREIIATNWDGRVYVLSPKGEELWTYDVKTPIYGQASIADFDRDGVRDIVFGAWDGRVYAVSGRTHSPLWPPRKISGSAIEATAEIARIDADDVPEILIGSQDKKFHALSGKDGAGIWTFTASSPVWPSRTLLDLDGDQIHDLVLRSADDGFVYVLSGADGTLLDTMRPGGNLYAIPAITDLDGDGGPDVVVASYDRNLYALRLRPEEYRRYRATVPALVQARRHFVQQRYSQALASLSGTPAPDPAIDGLRARCLFRLGRAAEALAALAGAARSGRRDPGLGALHLLAANLAAAPAQPDFVAACIASDPTVFLEALLEEEEAWSRVDPARFRADVAASLDSMTGEGREADLVRRVCRLLLGEPSPVLPPGIYDQDPVTIDFGLVLTALDDVLAGGLPQVAEARLSRLATAAGRRFASRWQPDLTEAVLRARLHLPPRR